MNLFPESNGTPTPSAQGNNIVHIDYKDTTAEFNNEEFIDMLMPNANSLV
ncbi:MAG: hypothetical protein LBP53_02095 [Candidatus Peribacteria bacterium]|nr:hypothetical protein [Candidatus Peribacteria bacterium]